MDIKESEEININKEGIKDLCPNCYLDFTEEENGIEICNICGFKIDENNKFK